MLQLAAFKLSAVDVGKQEFSWCTCCETRHPIKGQCANPGQENTVVNHGLEILEATRVRRDGIVPGNSSTGHKPIREIEGSASLDESCPTELFVVLPTRSGDLRV